MNFFTRVAAIARNTVAPVAVCGGQVTQRELELHVANRQARTEADRIRETANTMAHEVMVEANRKAALEKAAELEALGRRVANERAAAEAYADAAIAKQQAAEVSAEADARRKEVVLAQKAARIAIEAAARETTTAKAKATKADETRHQLDKNVFVQKRRLKVQAETPFVGELKETGSLNDSQRWSLLETTNGYQVSIAACVSVACEPPVTGMHPADYTHFEIIVLHEGRILTTNEVLKKHRHLSPAYGRGCTFRADGLGERVPRVKVQHLLDHLRSLKSV